MMMRGVAAIVLGVFLATTGAWESDGSEDCRQVQSRLHNCVFNNDIDFSRTGDPAYLRQLCPEVVEMLDCVDSSREACPGLPMFTGAAGQSLERTSATLRQHCADISQVNTTELEEEEEEEDRCPDLQGDLKACQNILLSIDPRGGQDSMCQAADSFEICVTDFLDRCSGHVGSEASHQLSQAAAMVRSQIGQGCVSQGTTSEEEEEEGEGEEEDRCPDVVGDKERCTVLATRIRQATDQDSVCQAASAFRDCVADFMDRCTVHVGEVVAQRLTQGADRLLRQFGDRCESSQGQVEEGEELETEDRCPNVQEDMEECQLILLSLNQPGDMDSLCQAAGTFQDCVTDFLDRCSGHVGEDVAQQMSHAVEMMQTQVDPHCEKKENSEENVEEVEVEVETEDSCPNVLEDMEKCQQIMMSLNRPGDMTNFCQAAGTFRDCVTDFLDRCSGHVGEDVAQQMSHAVEMMQTHVGPHCMQNETSEEQVQQQVEEEEDRCPNALEEIEKCQGIVMSMNQQTDINSMCRAFDAYQGCVMDFLERCSDQVGDEVAQQMSQAVEMMQTHVGQHCAKQDMSDHEEGEGEGATEDRCPNALQDMDRCQGIMTSWSQQEELDIDSMCQAIGAYRACVTEFLDRCPEYAGHETAQHMSQAVEKLQADAGQYCAQGVVTSPPDGHLPARALKMASKRQEEGDEE